MNNKKVIVLLSTYNGEKYLKEQIDSILNQSYPNIEIYIRDDGSKDKTTEILKQYQAKQIHVIVGENMGFVGSFFEVLKQAPQADYYAFADQDDVWEKDKIRRAIEILEENQNEDIPIMYYSNYDFYDENMNFVAHPQYRGRHSFENSLTECVCAGMAMIVNNKLKEMIEDKVPKKDTCQGHDWWIYMLCSTFGEVIYDEYSAVKHRIHTSNTSKCGEKFWERTKRRIVTLKNDNHFQKVQRQIGEFKRLYYNELNENQKQFIVLFDRPLTIKKQFKKLFYKQKIMNIWKEEIILKAAFLLGML